jgi:hypothetical protein
MSESRKVENLADLVPSEWRQNTDFQTARFRFFPTGIAINSEQAKLARELHPLVSKFAAHPVSFAILNISEVTNFHSLSAEISYVDGKRLMSVLTGERRMVPGDYMVIFSPIVTTNGQSKEGTTEDAINVCRGVLAATFGHASVDVPAYSCDSYLREVRTSLVSSTIENFPSVAAYTFIETQKIASLVERLDEHIDTSLRDRLETAFLLVGTAAAAVDSTLRLVNTWIALEVACGSRGKAKEALKLTTKDPDTYTRLKRARDDFFHKGSRRGFSPDDERVVHAALLNTLLQHYRLGTTAVLPMTWTEAPTFALPDTGSTNAS